MLWAGAVQTDELNTPKNMTLIFLPSRSPELNPVENIWQFLRANRLANRVFETCDDVVEAACDAWNEQPYRLTKGHRLHRHARLGPYRSIISAVGMSWSGS